MANAFSLQSAGSTPTLATPNNGSTYQNNVSGLSVTPVPTPKVSSGLVQSGSNGVSQPIYQGLLPTSAPTATTPLASTTVIDPSGNTVKHTYQTSAPEIGVSSPSALKSSGTQSTYTPPAGEVNVGTAQNPILQPAQSNGTAGMYQPSTVANPSTSSPQNTTQAATADGTPITQPLNNTTAAQGVLLAGQMTPQEAYYSNMAVTAKQLQNINALSPYANAGLYGNQPGQQLAPDLAAPDFYQEKGSDQGLAGSLGNIFGSAAQTGYANALQQQQLGLGAAENVLSAAAPQSQFGQLTNPFSGQVIGAGTSGNNPALDSAVQAALQIANSGAGDAAARASLAGYGQAGLNAYIAAQQAQNPNYNPTATDAQTQQNITQGQQYQGQAAQVDTALKSVDALSGTVSNLLNQSGYNPSDSGVYNQPIDTYISSLGNTEAAKQVALYIGDIKKYTGQILATNSGTIPTDTSNTLASIDPSTLNGAQLQNYIQTIDYLGQTQRNVLQQQQEASYGQSGGYSGDTGAAVPAPVSAPNTAAGSGLQGQRAQGLAGVGLNVGTDLAKVVSSGSNILSFILGKVGL